DVAGALFDQPRQRIVGRRHPGPPGRGLLAALVEAFDEGEEIAQLGAVPGVDEDVVAHAGIGHAQGEGRVEVSWLQEEQRMHDPTLPMVPRAPARTAAGYGSPAPTTHPASRLRGRACLG